MIEHTAGYSALARRIGGKATIPLENRMTLFRKVMARRQLANQKLQAEAEALVPHLKGTQLSAEDRVLHSAEFERRHPEFTSLVSTSKPAGIEVAPHPMRRKTDINPPAIPGISVE